MSMETVEIALGLNAHVLSGPLTSAQSALLAQLKAAGNALVFSMAVETGNGRQDMYRESFPDRVAEMSDQGKRLAPYTSWRGAGVQSGRRRRSGDPSRIR